MAFGAVSPEDIEETDYEGPSVMMVKQREELMQKDMELSTIKAQDSVLRDRISELENTCDFLKS
jgi:hypothetical protein